MLSNSIIGINIVQSVYDNKSNYISDSEDGGAIINSLKGNIYTTNVSSPVFNNGVITGGEFFTSSLDISTGWCLKIENKTIYNNGTTQDIALVQQNNVSSSPGFALPSVLVAFSFSSLVILFYERKKKSETW